MGNLDGFDANNTEPAGTSEPLPSGKYTAVISKSEMVDTRAGDVQLKLTFQIVDGPHKGRNVWDRLFWVNNEKGKAGKDEAVRISKGKLSSICHAIGVMRPSDSSELHGKPLTIIVGEEPRKGSADIIDNVIRGCEKAGPTPKQIAAPGYMDKGAAPEKPANMMQPGEAPKADDFEIKDEEIPF